MSEQTETPAPGQGRPQPGGPEEQGAPEQQGVPWIDPEIQQHVEWRDGDIVVSVPLKSGTTWTMNIVHQLREGGDPDLECVYSEVPWLELVPEPGVSRDELVARIDALPAERRRAFKTHSAPGALPFQASGSGRDVKYVVIVRNPDEAVASMYPFIKKHSEDWLNLWEIDKAELVPPDFATFFEHFAKPMSRDAFFSFVEAWWPLRNEPNVLMMHFTDMKRDHEGSVRRIAEFLGFEPTDDEWAAILECTSFPWMKKHEHKFEARGVTRVPILESGAMVRKGKAGSAREDGVTPEISGEVEQMGREVLSDSDALDWMYKGGALP